MKQNNNALTRLVEKYAHRKIVHRIVALLCAITVLFTVNTLKFNADTLERYPMCGFAEHVHNETCLNTASELICGLEEHIHTDACYQQRPVVNEFYAEEDIASIESAPIETAVMPEDIESDEIEPAVEELGELMLGGDAYVAEEALSAEAVDAADAFAGEPVYSLLNRDYITLSDMSLPLQMEEVISVLEVVPEEENIIDGGDEAFVSTLCIEKIDQDYIIIPNTGFAEREVAIETAAGIYLVKLTDGGVGEAEAADLSQNDVSDLDQDEAADLPLEETEVDEITPDAAEDDDEKADAAEDTDTANVEVNADEQPDDVAIEIDAEITGDRINDVEDKADAIVEKAADEQSADDVEAVADEQSADDVEAAADEQSADDVEAAADEQSADDVEAVADEQSANDEPSATIIESPIHIECDLTEVESYPLSLLELVSIAPTDETKEPVVEEADVIIEESIPDTGTISSDDADVLADEDIEIKSQAIEVVPEEMVIELGESDFDALMAEAEAGLTYDSTLLSVERNGFDYLITPIASFNNTDIIWGVYVITLQNGHVDETLLPAQEFTASTAFVSVSVAAPEGAFPEGTSMTVTDVEDAETVNDIAETVNGGFVEVERVHAVDISFCDSEGTEIEPLLPISVVMTAIEQVEEDQEAVVVHVDDEGDVEVVDVTSTSTDEPEMDANETELSDIEASVAFTADSFSVYALVVTKKLETKVLASDGETYHIDVTYTENAGIPDDAVLAVMEVTEDESYLKTVEAELPGNKMVTLARFFDIKIMDGDEEVHPLEAVEVRVTLVNEADTAAEKAEIKAEEIAEIEADEAEEEAETEAPEEESSTDHIITLGEPVPAAIHFQEESSADTMEARSDEDAVVFMAEGFSVWGVVYTVDFYYGNYEYHLDGGESMRLSALFELLEIKADAADVADVQFTDDTLVQVEQIENDWLLTSLAPFQTEETLTVTMKDGTVYVVKVEDDQEKITITIKAWPSADNGWVSANSRKLPSSGNQGTYEVDEKYNLYNTTKEDYEESKVLATVKDSQYVKTSNSWNEGHEGEYKFVGFLFENEGVKQGGNSYTDAVTVAPYTFASKGKAFWLSQSTTVTAFFKESSKTLLYFTTDGNGTLDKNCCYTTDTLPTSANPQSYHIDHWEINGVAMTSAELQALKTDSVVKAVFKEGPAPVVVPKYTFNYINILNGTVNGQPLTVEYMEGDAVGGGTSNDAPKYTVFIGWVDSAGRFLTKEKALSHATVPDFPATATEDHDYYAHYLWDPYGPETGPEQYLLGYADKPEGISWKTEGSDNTSGTDKLFISKLGVKGHIYFYVEPGYELVDVSYNGASIKDKMLATVEGDSVKYLLNYDSEHNVHKIINESAISGLNQLVVTLREADSHTVIYRAGNLNDADNDSPGGTVSPDQETVSANGAGNGSTATSNSGNYFGFWTDEAGSVVSADATFAPQNVLKDKTYTAHFYDAGRLIFYSTDSGETLTSNNVTASYFATAVDANELIAVSNTSRFKYWTMDGKFYSYNTSIGADDVSKNRDTSKSDDITFLAAIYADDASDVVAYKAGVGGTVSNDVDLTSAIRGSKATPGTGYAFAGWYTDLSDEETLFSTNAELKVSDLTGIHANTTLYAKFTAAETCTITYIAAEHGGVKQPSGGDYAATYQETVQKGGKAGGAKAEATRNSGYTFMAWTDSDGNVVSTDATIKPSGAVMEDTNYTAHFYESDKKFILIEVNNPAWGGVYDANDGNGNSLVSKLVEIEEVPDKDRLGSSIAFFAVPASTDYSFDHWELDGTDADEAGTIEIGSEVHQGTPVFPEPTKSVTSFKAVFRPTGAIKVNYMSSDTALGTVSSASDFLSATVPASGVTAIPADGKALKYWYIMKNGQEVVFSTADALTSEQVNMDTVTDGTTIYAKFGDKPANATFTIVTETGDSSQGGFTSGGYTDTGDSKFFDTGATRLADSADSSLMYEITKAKFRNDAPQYLNAFRNAISGSAKDGYHFAFFLDQHGNGFTRLSGGLQDTYAEDVIRFTAYFAADGYYRYAFRTEGDGVIKVGAAKDTAVQQASPYVPTEGDLTPVWAAANEGSVFAGWYDSNDELVSMDEKIDPATLGQDLVLTAKFITPTEANVTVTVNNADWGRVTVAKNDGTTDDTDDGTCAFTTKSDNETEQTITAEAKQGYIFLQWLVNGKKVSAQEMRSASITDKTVVFRDGDTLQAVFAQITPVEEDLNPAESHVDLPKESLEKWKESLENGKVLQNTDKTAQVSPVHKDAYGNRIYQVDITAQSNIMDLTADIDLAFIMDASNSMKFPSKLVRKLDKNGEPLRMVLTQDSLDALYPNAEAENKCCYIISDPNNTAKVYRIYKKNGLWRYTDASYNDLDVISWNGTEEYEEAGHNAPYSFLIYEDGDPGMRRLDHLNNSLQTAIRTASGILQSVGVDQNTSEHKIRVAYDTFAFTTKRVSPDSSFQWEDFQLLDDSTEMSVAYQAGGTRQDLGIRDAGFFSWDTTQATQKYAILITDGAPVPSSAVDEIGKNFDTIRDNVVVQADALKAQDITLITVGLSTKNVKGGSQLLYQIASDIDGQRQFYEAESGDDLEAILLKILRTIIAHAELRGSITDTVDPVFYPVDENGDPITEGYYNMDGEKLDNAPTDGTTLYYKWDKDSDGCWRITWYNQPIGWEDEHTDWHEHFFLKTKENFLGGNVINTNKGDAVITPDGYRLKGDSEWIDRQFKDTDSVNLPTPYVNIDELALTKNDTEWTVYLDTQVDPKTQINELLRAIDVLKVVSGDTNEMITTKDQMLGDTSEESSKRFKLGSIDSLTGIASGLTDAQWDKLINGVDGDHTIELPYAHYGHTDVGTIKITLSQEQKGSETRITVTEDGGNYTYSSPHAATVIGSEVEKYTLTVTYTPTPVGEVENWHTTKDGTPGDPTDNMSSVNTHKINVFAKSLQIAKQDPDKRALSGAEFKLYRTARTGDDEASRVTLSGIDGEEFIEAATLTCNEQGIATRQFTLSDKLGDNEHYYLVETRASAGYNLLTTPIPVTFKIADSYTSVPSGTASTIKPESGLYDWTETAGLWFDLDESLRAMVHRVDADGKDATDTLSPNSTTDTVYYRVVNNPGVKLPSTGGPGTTVFYVTGLSMIALALLLLLQRRRERGEGN